jgi:hypothetical protein
MKKLLIQKEEGMLSGLIFVLTGMIGSILDYFNGEQHLISFKLFGHTNPVEISLMKTLNPRHEIITVDSSFFLFIIIGFMLFIISLHDVKSDILVYSIPSLLITKIKLIKTNGMLQYYKWTNRPYILMAALFNIIFWSIVFTYCYIFILYGRII